MAFFHSVPLILLMLMCITNASEKNTISNIRHFPQKKLAFNPVKLFFKRSLEERFRYARFHDNYFDKVRPSEFGEVAPITHKKRGQINTNFASDAENFSSSKRLILQNITTTTPESIRKITEESGTTSEENDTDTQLNGKSWEEWSSWSQCSVTCGKGRQIRWRHCIILECIVADSEMEEKTCNLPSCSS